MAYERTRKRIEGILFPATCKHCRKVFEMPSVGWKYVAGQYVFCSSTCKRSWISNQR